MDDLEKLLAEDEKVTQPAPLEPEKVRQEETKDPEVQKKEEEKANLDKAILEAQDQLRKIREEKKKVKTEEEELPKIDLDDPSAKAWDRHMREKVNPLQQELDQEKAEVRNFAIKEFLSDKPALAKNPEKLKELVSNYERIKTASERTKEGVLLDLDRAYAATFHKELLDAARSRRVEQAQGDILFSDIAVSRGATSYAAPKVTAPKLTDEERMIVAKWDAQLAGMGVGEK